MASAGFGSLCGALYLATRSSIRGLGRIVAASALMFGVALMLFALSRAFWLSAALLLVVGMSLITQAASTNTLIQSMVPDSLRGRVMAVYAMMLMGMSPIGALVEGALAQRIGAPYPIVIGGSVCVAGAIIFNMRLPALRVMARQLIDAQRPATTEAPAPLT
jgi:MFS family permease